MIIHDLPSSQTTSAREARKPEGPSLKVLHIFQILQRLLSKDILQNLWFDICAMLCLLFSSQLDMKGSHLSHKAQDCAWCCSPFGSSLTQMSTWRLMSMAIRSSSPWNQQNEITTLQFLVTAMIGRGFPAKGYLKNLESRTAVFLARIFCNLKRLWRSGVCL